MENRCETDKNFKRAETSQAEEKDAQQHSKSSQAGNVQNPPGTQEMNVYYHNRINPMFCQ